MNVLIVSQFFPPESCAASSRTASIANALHSAGHRVRIVTAYPSFPNGRIAQSFRPWAWMREMHEGSVLIRVPTYASPRLRARDRLLNWASVALGAALTVVFSRERIDCVFVTCPPVTLALPALLAAWIKRCPLFVDVRDSYPDVAIKMGVWREDGILAKVVARIVSVLYRRADAISCVTETVRKEVVARGAAPDRTFVAPNGYDAVAPSASSVYPRTPQEFVVAFAGNMGVAAGVEVILEAAQRLSAQSKIRFVLAGGGSDFENLSERKKRYGLNNVMFLGALDRAGALAVLRDADLCVVPLRRGIADSLPTKMFDALYVKCPVLVSGGGEARRFAEVSGGGWAVPAEDPDALAKAIAQAASDRDRCRAAGELGQAYVLENCSRSAGAGAVSERITTLRSCTTIAKSTQTYL